MIKYEFEKNSPIIKDISHISQKLDDLTNERNALKKINDFLSEDALAQSRWVASVEQHLQGNPQALRRLEDISESDRKEASRCQVIYEEALKSNSSAIKEAEEEYDVQKQKLAKMISKSKERSDCESFPQK